jgi:ubiquinone/menaquinone biosynthesis C-methylase UbiE
MNEGSTGSQNFATRYQSVLVPVIFEPWARELISRAALQGGEHILDLACGTGVVTREIAKSGASPGSLTAVDYSKDMLSVARDWASRSGLEAEWVEADAGDLPFKSNQFDVAFCQQALQFFPNQPGALRELRRVMKSGARVVICVQRELSVNPMLKSQAEALDKHVGRDAGAAVRAICSLSESDELLRLFEGAGFRDVKVESVSLDLYHPDGRAFAEGAMGGMHTGDKLTNLTEASIERAIDDFLAGLGGCYDGTTLNFPHVSNVISARA